MKPLEEKTIVQINKAVAIYRAFLEKNAKEFEADAVHDVLKQLGFVKEQVEVFLRRVLEVQSNMIVRRVKIKTWYTNYESINAPHFELSIDRNNVYHAPQGKKEKVSIVLFKLEESKRGGYISGDDMHKEFILRGLEPAYLNYLAAMNEADPAFTDSHPNITLWKNVQTGEWCYAYFSRVCDQRHITVSLLGKGSLKSDCWFAGIR